MSQMDIDAEVNIEESQNFGSVVMEGGQFKRQENSSQPESKKTEYLTFWIFFTGMMS